jgi:hypothetical protein
MTAEKKDGEANGLADGRESPSDTISVTYYKTGS